MNIYFWHNEDPIILLVETQVKTIIISFKWRILITALIVLDH